MESQGGKRLELESCVQGLAVLGQYVRQRLGALLADTGMRTSGVGASGARRISFRTRSLGLKELGALEAWRANHSVSVFRQAPRQRRERLVSEMRQWDQVGVPGPAERARREAEFFPSRCLSVRARNTRPGPDPREPAVAQRLASTASLGSSVASSQHVGFPERQSPPG